MQEKENALFRWNCETLFCVEAFFREALLQAFPVFLLIQGILF